MRKTSKTGDGKMDTIYEIQSNKRNWTKKNDENQNEEKFKSFVRKPRHSPHTNEAINFISTLRTCESEMLSKLNENSAAVWQPVLKQFNHLIIRINDTELEGKNRDENWEMIKNERKR